MQSPITLKHPNGNGTILIEGCVFDVIQTFLQTSPSTPEAGGILLGYRRDPHIHVVEASVPQIADERSRYRFFRSSKPHRSFAIDRWRKSGKKIDYIGEWHTHPETKPTPSSIDYQSWINICETRMDPMLFLIAGDTGNLWFGLGRYRNLTELHPWQN